MTKVFFTDKCPAFMREAITEILEQQQKQPEITQVPPWRQKGVCVAGHALFNERPDNECPICGEPTTASGDCQHSPDCESHEKFMMDTIYEQVCHDSRLTGLEERLTAVQTWADIHYQPNEKGHYVINNCIHDLIAEGMTGVTRDASSRIDAVSERLAIWEQWAAKQEKRIDDALDYVAERTEGATTQCNQSAVALVTVAVEAMDTRMDAICRRNDLMVEAMQMMTARIESLEQQNALLNRQAH